MKSEVLKLFPWIDLSCLGLVIFFVFFIGVLYRVFSEENRPIFDYAQNIPLKEDANEP